MQSIFDPGFLLFQFCFGTRPDVNLSHASGKFGQTLLELFSVVFGVGGGDFGTNLLNPSLDIRGGPGTLHDGAFVGTDHDLLGSTEACNLDFFELHPKIFHHGFATGKNRNVLQHCFAAIAVSRGFDRSDLQHTPKFVDHQRRQRFPGDVFRDDQERLLGLHGFFKKWDQSLDGIDFVFVDQNQRLVQNDFHLFGVGYEIGGEESTIKLHALDDIDPGLEALPFLDRDHTVFPHLGQGLCHDLADGDVIVCTDGRDRSHVIADWAGLISNLIDHCTRGLVHATHQCIGVHASRQLSQAGLKQGLG